MSIPEIDIETYTYSLPTDRIAQHPLPERDESKLLCYTDGVISEDRFSNLSAHLPSDCLMVFNNTRVIRARLLFQKPTGAIIEIFCVEPLEPTRELQEAFRQTGSCRWKCLIGNARRWKTGMLEQQFVVSGRSVILTVSEKELLADGTYTVSFTWNPASLSFGEVLEMSGQIPLPPYINRNTEPEDQFRYQTLYADQDGSVAAPTAGLHFTKPVLRSLREAGIRSENVTLHIGLGTFKPVSSADIHEHIMHREEIVVTEATIRYLLLSLDRPVIAVGTTSVRTLESLYWIGVKLLSTPEPARLSLEQWDPYTLSASLNISAREALEQLIEYMYKRDIHHIRAETQIMIIPGYSFRIISGMLTNFHQPRSTLLLLIAAYLGADWKKVYRFALENGFRFLSYGDACLFQPK